MKTFGKLFIQIPCLNELTTIGAVIKSIPKRELNKRGFLVKILIIDDGSSDQTSKSAKKAGADFIIKHKRTFGLAKSFSEGLEFCLRKGADIIVNTDGDNQYDQREILKLVDPIISGQADMVIGDRQVKKLETMPLIKKLGNLIGSFVLRSLTGVSVPDASSGFRAFSRELAENFNLQSDYTYTHETIIQASNKGFKIISLPVVFKKRTDGGSRLISRGVYDHIKKSMATIIRTILLYKALKYLLIAGSLLLSLGVIIGLRFVYFYIQGDGRGHIQSLVLSSVLLNLGFMVIVLGFMADLISVNRKTLEMIKSKLESQ